MSLSLRNKIVTAKHPKKASSLWHGHREAHGVERNELDTALGIAFTTCSPERCPKSSRKGWSGCAGHGIIQHWSVRFRAANFEPAHAGLGYGILRASRALFLW